MLPIQLHGLKALVVEELQEVKGVALEVYPVLTPDAAATPSAASSSIRLHLCQAGRETRRRGLRREKTKEAEEAPQLRGDPRA